MDLLTVLGYIVLAVAIGTSIAAYLKANKINSKNELAVFDKTLEVLNIVRDALPKAYDLAMTDKLAEDGYDKVKELVLDQIAIIIYSSSKLTTAQKDLLTSEMIESLVEPLLRKLWETKFEMPQKNVSGTALRKIREELAGTDSKVVVEEVKEEQVEFKF